MGFRASPKDVTYLSELLKYVSKSLFRLHTEHLSSTKIKILTVYIRYLMQHYLYTTDVSTCTMHQELCRIYSIALN